MSRPHWQMRLPDPDQPLVYRRIVARNLQYMGWENNRLPPERREEHPGTKGDL